MSPMRHLRHLPAALLALAAFGLSPGRAAAAAFDIPPDLGSYAVLSCQDFQMSGNSTITSEGVGGGTAGDGKAHVRSNGNVVISGTAEVHGDVTAGPGKRITLSGHPVITGQQSVASSPFNCTPVDLAALKLTLQQSNDNARIPQTDRGHPGLSNGGITMSGNDGLTLPAGTYLLSGISLSGNSQLRVSGQVRILVTGSIAISGGSNVNLNGNPFQMHLWSQGAISISSQSNIHAYLYAPTAAVSLSGAINIVGAIQTQSFQISGGVHIRRTTDDAPPAITLTAPVAGQSVTGCQVTVSGKATDAEGPVAQLTVNGAVVATAADGSFSTTASLATADPSLVTVKATDGGGNTTSVTVRVSLVPPTVALTSPASGSLVGNRLVDLAGTCGNATAVTVNGRAAVVSSGTFHLTGFDLGAQDGLVTLALAASACGGTANATASLDLDTKAPVVAIDGPAPGDVFGRSPITVTGTAADAHLTAVTVNGVTAQRSGGRFTATGVPLVQGTHNTLVARATDALGRTTDSAPVTVELDTVALTAVITDPVSGAVVSTPQITVRGTVSKPNITRVVVNGVVAVISGTGFTATGVHLSEGETPLVATVTGTTGATADSPSVVAVLDTLPPVIALDTAALPALTGQTTVPVSGTVSDPHLQQVTVNGVTATVTAGRFAAAAVPLQEGANPVVARAVDTLGHAAETAPATVTRDTLPPQVAITDPGPDAQLASRTLTVRGTVSDPHLQGVTVQGVAATVIAPSGGAASGPSTFEAPGVQLPEGASQVTAHAVDQLGHAADAAPVAVVVDTLAPQIAITSPANGEVVTSLQAAVTGTVSDPNLTGVTVNGVTATLDAAAGTFSAAVPVADGANTLTAIATDRGGHTAQAAVTVILDTLPPAVSLDLPAVVAGGCLAAGAPYTLGGTFTDSSPATGQGGQPPPVTVEVTDAAGAHRSYSGVLSADGRRWTAAGVDLGSSDGVTTVLVTAADSLRNTARVSAAFRIDALPPVVRLTLDGAAFPGAAAGATAPAGSVPALFGRRIAPGVVVEDGAAAAPPPAVLTLDGASYAAGAPIAVEGTHLLAATAIDCAGHAASVHALFALDTTPPALRSTVPAANARVTAAPGAFAGVSDPDLAKATVNGSPATVSAAGAFTLSPFPWREGSNPVAIELEDRAGNRASFQVTFTVRTVPLAVQIVEGGAPIAAGAAFLRPVRPEARASDSTAAVSLTLNGAPFASGTQIAQTGSYRLAATASDDWGRSATAEATFTLDLGAGPRIAINSPADGAVVPGPAVRVAGTVSGDAPTVTVNGAAATVTGGNWEVVALPLEADAANPLAAVARDRQGRTATAGVTVRVVSGGPQILILEPADGVTTNRAAVDVAGVVVGGRTHSADGTVSVQGKAVDLAPDGTFRALDVPLQTGANSLTATVKDREGRTGSAAVRITADFTPPAIRFFTRATAGGAEEALADGASFGRPVTLVVVVQDDALAGPAPQIRLNGVPYDAAASPRTEIPLTNGGGYVVTVAVADAAGNEARGERSFVLDFGGCSLAGVTPEAGSAVATAAVTLVGRATGAAVVKVRVPQPGGPVQEYVASLADGTFLAGDVPLPVVGQNLVELVCIDASGAVQSTPHAIERLAAGAGPTIRITAPAAGQSLGADTVPVTGTVSGGAVTVNGLAAVVTPGSPAQSFQAAAVPLAEGPNPLLARAVDAAGRTAEDRVVVDRDTQAPKVQITRPDNHSQVGLNGTGAATIEVSGLVDLDTEPHLDRVVVSTPKGSVTATVDPRTGAFVASGVPLDPAAGAGVFQTVTATATDALGHAGTSSAEVALDPAGPAIVLADPADLSRFAAGAPAQITVRGEAWGAPGTALSLNGINLDPASLAWEAPGADGRRHVAFTAAIATPGTDGPFGIIARATDLQGRWAQDRRLLFRDATAPRVVELVPADGATGIDANGLLLVLFSEPILHASLDVATGLTLTRVSTGQTVVGTKTVAGQAVAFAPGAALAAGETYVLRAGTGITDAAGNALATPAEARLTVATLSTGGPPVLNPLPAVVCASELRVSGKAAAGATVKVRDGDLVFTGFADSSGAFTVAVPVSGSGYHLLSAWALDAVSGARSPDASLVVRVDCRAPTVVDAQLDRQTGIVRVVFSEAIDAATLTVGGAQAAGAAIRLLDADVPGVYQSGTLSLPSDSSAEIRLDTTGGAWWRDRPVRLQVGPPAADREGNVLAAVFERVFFPGGGDLSGGFLFGEVYDDTTGRPLAGGTVSLFTAGQATAPLAGAVTDGRGRFVLTGGVPAGRYVLSVAGGATTRVYRRLSLNPAAGVVPFDSRVTPLAEPAGTLQPAAGGSLVSGGMTFVADPAALPGTAAVTVRLTPLSGQGLPDFLPLGWTPAAAAELRLEQGGTTLPEQGSWTLGAARLELPLPSWVAPGDAIYAARYEPATGRWLALPIPERIAGSGAAPARARIAIAGPGTVAVVIPDGDPATRPPSLPAAEGEALTGVQRPATVPALTADLTLDPPVVGPTGRSRARVVARSADASSAAASWPSGLAVQAYLEEKLVLAGGGEVLEAPFSADLVLYHPRLTPAEQGAASAGAAGAMDFAVSPSPRAAQVLLDVGWENIRLFPFPEEVERGPVVGPDGGAIETPAGVQLAIPEGALGAKVPVTVILLSAADLAALPPVAGYDTLAAVRIEISGATLARPATLSLLKPAGTPAEAAGQPRVVLAELMTAPADGRGALADVVSRTRRDGSGEGERVVAAPELAGALPLDGILREGVYLLLAAHQPLGFATGFVKNGAGTGIAFSRVTAAGLGTGDLSRLTGRYAVPVTAGSNQTLQALHPARDEKGVATIASLAPGQVVSLDLVVEPVPPRVVSVAPLDGATSQPLATAVSVLFSEPLDPATVTSSTLTLELAGTDGQGTGVFIDGTVTLADGLRVVFAPSRPLLPGHTFLARFTGGVADAGGTIYAGPPLLWSFSTSTAVVPGGQIHPEKLHVRIPVNGVAEIYGDPGALPGSLPGQTPWAVSPEIEGPAADPLRDTFQARADGSFNGTVGHPPQFAVALGSRVWLKIFDPTGALAAQVRVGPFVTPDGLGFVAPAGEDVTFRSAEGLVVDVPAAAFAAATLVRVRLLDPATFGVAVPQGLGMGAYVNIDFDGEAQETLRVSVPAPAGAADGAQVFMGQVVALPWGPRLQILSVGGVLARDGQRYLSNDPSLQPEPAAAGLSAPSRAKSLLKSTGRTCRTVRQEGLNRCFLQSLLMEFTLRSTAAFLYEQGVDWSLLTGFAQPFPIMLGMAQEAIFNFVADSWVYMPRPHDWNGGFVLPVISQQPLELARRDTATGWLLARQTYNPVPGTDGLIDVGFLGEGKPSRPLLIDAKPFQLYRQPAPEPNGSTRLSLEMEMKADAAGQVTVSPVAGFPLARGSSLTLYDLSPTSPEPPKEGQQEQQPAPPIAGPALSVCDPAQSWVTTPLAGSDDLLVVLAPGGLDAAALDQFELQFDRPLRDLADKPPAQVAHLLDLGPLAEQACGSSTAAGYPKTLPLTLEQTDRRSRLILHLQTTLPAGHRFRLELVAGSLIVDDPGGLALSYWETAPTRFDFATREVPGEPISGAPQGSPALGTTNVARDLLKLGNLLLVASETGDLVAFDVSHASETEGLRRYALKNRGVQSATRSLATDGHNRIFYSGQFGSVWGIKTVRLEDVRAASSPCVQPPDWAQGLPCFEGVEGSVRIAYALGTTSGTTASEWLALGTLPEGVPMKLSVLTQDEKGKSLELADFVKAYAPGVAELAGLTPDAEGIYTFDLPLRSTLARSRSNKTEPSLPPGTPAEPPVEKWRQKVCAGEEDWDRYQRVTVDNLTTGQSWSIDLANPWPDGGGDGGGLVAGVRARKGDLLQVRYNLRTLGHVAIVGSGITVVDLNRFYRLTQPFQSAGSGQCGRRLGKFEGQQLQFPDCAPPGIEIDGIAMTSSLAVHSRTGCDRAPCRGEGFIDIYSPLSRVGALHTRSTVTAPGGVENGLFGTVEGPEALQISDMAACIQTVGDSTVLLRDVALANDALWTFRGVHGQINGVFQEPPANFKPQLREGDLLFVSLGVPGIFVFDVSARSLLLSPLGGPALVGHLAVHDHTAFRLQVDSGRGLLFAGGTDLGTGEPVIDVWDILSINGAPGLEGEPAPRATLHAPWSTNQLGIDATGTGLLYTWGTAKGPQAVPFDRARFVFSGLYRPEGKKEERGISNVQMPTSRFVPLGVPLETSLADEKDHHLANEEKATAAFKLRVALPGSLGPELTAKVQSLRSLPGEESLGKEDVGASVALPGGPGWPENEVVVRLRRVGLGSEDGTGSQLTGEAGPLGTAYQLYESVETVLLLADPRARAGYRRQDAPGNEQSDEMAQCRRCDWPGYLPDSLTQDQAALRDIKELVAGRYVRAFLFPTTDDGVSPVTRQATEAAIHFFAQHDENYPLPAGSAEIAGPADSVPSPFQVSLAEPAQNAAVWSPGEAGVSVALPGGEGMLATTDHRVAGRAIPFTMDRAYRSGLLGYGALGSAGWSAGLFAHLRELPVTGEVEYQDGQGHVWRFFPRSLAAPPEGTEKDDAGSYYPPVGVYLRLQKLPGGRGWRMIGRQHDVALFDGLGRLMELSDRQYRGGTEGAEQGNRMQLRYDPFGQLVDVEDDLGRRYRFEYFDDPRPKAQGGDGPHYGLLKSVKDFVDREIAYEFDDDRRLTEVKLAEVGNPVDELSSFSYRGSSRPTLKYHYDPQAGVSSSDDTAGAVLHGKFAKLRLESYELPEFVPGVNGVPRARFEYDSATGRVRKVGFPTQDNQNSSTSSVAWSFTPDDKLPATRVTVRAPWDHTVENTLEKGRVTHSREELAIERPAGSSTEPLDTSFTYADDGRLLSTDLPNGSRSSQCYADGQGGAGCAPGGGGGGDRLARANVTRSLTTALTQAAKGSADYDSVDTKGSYQEDNQLSSLNDGMGRPINFPVPQAGDHSAAGFGAEHVSASFDYDRFGRVKKSTGGGTGGATVTRSFGEDARHHAGAGLLTRVERGSGALWQELSYDKAFNVRQVRTSQGTRSDVDHDDWDREVRSTSGISEDGRLATVGAAECAAGKGAIVARAFDAAGHVVRTRRLQDYVDPVDGGTKCRWVETQYVFNAREQLVSEVATHLASATNPGQVSEAPQEFAAYAYDEFGRLAQEKAKAVSRPDLVTAYAYDAAGRVASTRVGAEGARRRGYDEASRVVLQTDGDEGVWRGQFDAWDCLYQEASSTGAVTRRRFDQAGNPIEESVFDTDPSLPGAHLLAGTLSHVTSFGAVDRVTRLLTPGSAAPGSGTPAEVRVTEKVFDDSGRVIEVWSGPPLAGDSSRVDRLRARREVKTEYEPATGRVLAERYGGDANTPPLHAKTYTFATEGASPWPDTVSLLESVPGQSDLVSTFSTSFRRDALGRSLEERRSDGNLRSSVYDRAGGAIVERTGAGTESAVSFDGSGRAVKTVRPNGRGFSVYAYDLDGSLLLESTRGAAVAALWETAYAYDSTGRVSKVTYADGTTQESTYNLDSTVATVKTRDGLTIAYAYDAANRLKTAIPATAAGAASPTLLDAGDRISYDPLSRPTALERGRPGAAGYDPALAVHYPAYDLASRPASEVVGTRAPLTWGYDVFDRPTSMVLPAGTGRGAAGAFQGFERGYDTLDRLVEISGLGAAGLSRTPLGARWTWGGADRLYGMSTKGVLGTTVRYGYHGGAGPQVPGFDAGQASAWKLGTLTWGSAGTSAAPSAPQTPWGGFGFGWRGNEGTPSDGAKLGRQVLPAASGSPDLFSGLGWAWGYDGGVRLTSATSGQGDLKGEGSATGDAAETFRFGYGEGDQLSQLIRQSTGQIAALTTGEYGRITARNGAAFSYDGVGRRLEDDRFVYRWDWRGQLASVTVKSTWPDGDGDGKPDVTPWAGHQVRYDYDASGRMTHRWLYGKLPAGVTDDAQRPFIEKRVFVWEGDGLAAEAAFGNPEETLFRWRKTYVPGPGGLDDAVQVVVEDTASGTTRTYTLVRDEMGTVVSLVAEDEGTAVAKPPVPVRYRYTPYGEAHAESGPELLRARFDGDATTAATASGTVTQAPAAGAAAGSLLLDWTLPLDAGTIPAGLVVERLVGPSGWVALAPEDFVVGPAPADGGISTGGGPPQRLRVLVKNGWTRGASYRVRLAASLTDGLSRRFGRTEELEWRIPEAEAGNPNPAVAFDKRIPLSYETWEAATNNITDRFPGGQTLLFQGLWTDPVTGVAYARARWYDARNAVWLSEDPMGPEDSANLYAFVGLQPNSRSDPLGLWSWEAFGEGAAKAAIGIVVATVVVAAVAATGGAAAVVIAGALGATTATAATVGAVVSAGVYVAASAYGGFQVGTKIYEATTGKQYDLNGQGRQLTDDERSEAAGEAATGVLALGIMAGRARSTEVQDQQLINNLVETRVGRIAAGNENGKATFAQGQSVRGTVTPVAESVETPDGTGPHAEPQAMPLGGTTAVDQVPCNDCASRALLRGTRVIVPEDPAKPGQSPKSAARAAAKGKITAQPRTVLPGVQGPIPFTGNLHRKKDDHLQEH